MKLYKARHILKDIRDDNADEYDNDTIMDAIDTVINKFESGTDGIAKDSIVAAFKLYWEMTGDAEVRQ